MELWAYAFDSTCIFPFERCLFRYEGREFVLYSGNDEQCEVIQTIINHPNERDKVFQIIQKFLFCYGWDNHCYFHFTADAGMGLPKPIDLLEREPIRVKRKYRNLLVNFEYIISPATRELEVALSLYNDAKYTPDQFYAFICYWKILEIPYSGRTLKPVDWINDVIKKGCNIYITDYIRDLISKNRDIGKFFKEKCRNAIAHIERRPTVVSFNADDYRQIASACSGIEPFTTYFIRNELGTPKYSDRIEVIKKIDKTTSPNT